MNYEMAVLAALLQLDKPTNPMITETTGISSRRVNLAINNLTDIKLKKTINYNLSQLKKAYSDEVRLENYRKI